MVYITPGVDFLVKGSLILGAFVGTIVTLNSSVATKAGYHIPTWMLLAGTTIAIPVSLTISVMSRKISNARQATTMGARIVPEAQGQWLGNLDILKKMMENLKVGYPGIFPFSNCLTWGRYSSPSPILGDGLDELLVKRGPVFNLRIMWSDLIFTASPEHIKSMLATDFQNYVKGRTIHGFLRLNLIISSILR